MAFDDGNSQGFTVADQSQYRSLQTVMYFIQTKLVVFSLERKLFQDCTATCVM